MTLRETMQDPKFNEFLQNHIDLHNQRGREIDEKTRWRREPYDALAEAGLLTVYGILQEFEKVNTGTCKLSSSQREAVAALVIQTAKEVMQYREVEAARKEARKLKNRIKRVLLSIKGWLKKAKKKIVVTKDFFAWILKKLF